MAGDNLVIQKERTQDLSGAPVRAGRYVLYWMQASQRAAWNHALEYATRQANDRGQPLLVGFGLTEDYPEAQERHYAFMLEGLAETQRALADRGVRLVVRRGSPDQVAVELAGDASLVVTDRGYTRHEKAWRAQVADQAGCKVVQVESDLVVPVEVASDKQEYAAATIRRKIHRHLDTYLVGLEATELRRDSLDMKMDGESLQDVDALLKGLRIDRRAGRVDAFHGGTSRAEALLGEFCQRKLPRYADERNDPSLDIQSQQSPYLHFGQVSPLWIALQVIAAKGAPKEAKDAYLEELIVRRELAHNFVHYTSRYDRYDALPDWARKTLAEHAGDDRPAIYTPRQLEQARTRDEYWNAAMREMLATGKMHNYMRMYWGKKVIEWTSDPKQAHRRLLALNNRYFLDGRDANTWTNVAWCFGLHDRAWRERPVFGKVRYMNAAGLERKFDMAAYVRWTEGL